MSNLSTFTRGYPQLWSVQFGTLSTGPGFSLRMPMFRQLRPQKNCGIAARRKHLGVAMFSFKARGPIWDDSLCLWGFWYPHRIKVPQGTKIRGLFSFDAIDVYGCSLFSMFFPALSKMAAEKSTIDDDIPSYLETFV